MKTHPIDSKKGQDILTDMDRVPVIVQGKLCERRSGGKVTGYKLQRWREGRNQTRYVPAHLVDKVREGTNGYGQFMALAQQYVELREREALEVPGEADAKKKLTRR